MKESCTLSDSTILCAVCNQDITALELSARATHTERCLDRASQRSLSSSSSGIKACLPTLDLLEDCPVCGSIWPAHVASRADHTKRCARRHGISDKDLVDLVNMFRESLGSTTDALDKVEHETPSAETDTRGCRAFIEVFSPSGHVAAAGPSSQQASVKEKKRAAVKVTSQRPRPIDGWLDRCSSAEPGSASDKQSASSKSSSQLPRGRISTSLETDDDDDDFQSTKARPALRQTQIAVHRVSKKQQAFLDDLDDDLNVAKAMSLSLKRGPDPAANGGKGAAAKRRDNSSGRADALAKSDILACSEAQSFIQQRAAVLEKMDEENPPIASLLYPRTGKAVAVFDNSKLSDSTTPPRLWDMGALPTATGREYCEIFESYKVRKDH
ncbi:5'-flap endonuclease [Coemansia sp. BCRC 34301]|nr:5'-flap endonuclease [Coemansia sp. BCRC 34301]